MIALFKRLEALVTGFRERYRLGGVLRREIGLAFAVGLAGFVLGALRGRPVLGVAVAWGLYGLIELNKLHRLYQWSRQMPEAPIPELGGLWDEVIRQIHRAHRDNERRKDQISGLFDRLQAAASAMPDAMIVLSQRDQIEWANPPAERLLGLDVAHDVGARLVHLVRDPLLSAYLDEGDYRKPLVLQGLRERFVVAVQIIPFGASQKLVIGRDITHLIKLEEMRNHFVADVSHEMRTPLTVLRGFLETLQDVTLDGSEDLRAGLALMQEQAERMQRLVDDLLTLSRLETAPPREHEEVVDINALVLNLKGLAQALGAECNHNIETVVATGSLLGNREELRSAFTNLVNNAVRHTPAGGTIRIIWEIDSTAGRFIVQDTGEGIAERHIPYLTERFYRVDSGRSRATGGTGLGLSIVRQVLDRHEAKLVVSSIVGQGSTFTCVFPVSRIIGALAP